jgi:hypothetical protein
MLKRHELERIWQKSKFVTKNCPSTYDSLVGDERLSVLRLLNEPIQSILHEILQQNVSPGTRCIYKGCYGTLDKTGHCSADCSQFGINVIDDIINCDNCSCYGFPCPTCYNCVFRKQIKMNM